jgi:hypothetical protein
MIEFEVCQADVAGYDILISVKAPRPFHLARSRSPDHSHGGQIHQPVILVVIYASPVVTDVVHARRQPLFRVSSSSLAPSACSQSAISLRCLGGTKLRPARRQSWRCRGYTRNQTRPPARCARGCARSERRMARLPSPGNGRLINACGSGGVFVRRALSARQSQREGL